MTDKDELASLRKRIEELEAKSSPPAPAKPFVPKPYQRYDPTEGMRMPPSALQAMAGHPCNQVMPGVIQDRHAPTGRPGMIPTGDVRGSAGHGTGYVDPRPLTTLALPPTLVSNTDFGPATTLPTPTA